MSELKSGSGKGKDFSFFIKTALWLLIPLITLICLEKWARTETPLYHWYSEVSKELKEGPIKFFFVGNSRMGVGG